MQCFFYNELPANDPHHVLPRSQFPSRIDDPENKIYVSRKAHRVLHDGTAEDLLRLPNFSKYLELMRTLDKKYHYRYCLKFDNKY